MEYLQQLEKSLERAAAEASSTAEVKQGAYAKYDNRRTVYKELQPEDQLYLLIRDSSKKLYAT